MKILAVGFAGEIVDNGIKVAGVSASYRHNDLNPFHDYFIAEIFTGQNLPQYKEAIVPKTSQFQREDGLIISFVKQKAIATNPLISRSIEIFMIIDGQSDNHVYITNDLINGRWSNLR